MLNGSDTLALHLLLAGKLTAHATLSIGSSSYFSQGSVRVDAAAVPDLRRTEIWGAGLTGVVAGHPAVAFVRLADGFSNAAVR